jgi:hypothetical protein
MARRVISWGMALMLLFGLSVLTASAEDAESVQVSFLGPAGTYTEEAAQFWFRSGEELLPKETVNDAVADVLSGEAEYAVIPQENTLGGPVTGYLDALIAAEDISVVGEVVLPICQTLMAVPGTRIEDITTVCSHSQGLAQSARWREENLPNAQTREMSSTAAAASFVADQQDKSLAAVAALRTVPHGGDIGLFLDVGVCMHILAVFSRPAAPSSGTACDHNDTDLRLFLGEHIIREDKHTAVVLECLLVQNDTVLEQSGLPHGVVARIKLTCRPVEAGGAVFHLGKKRSLLFTIWI